jgi:hypothetical protein
MNDWLNYNTQWKLVHVSMDLKDDSCKSKFAPRTIHRYVDFALHVQGNAGYPG